MTIQQLKLFGLKIDQEDEHILSKGVWSIGHKNRVASTEYYTDGTQETVLLHRVVTGAKEGQIVDHIDRNPLNNTKSNLRITTRRVNRLNTSKTYGVRSTSSGKFQARLGQANLGSFNTEQEAMQARRLAVEKEMSNARVNS